MAASSPIRITEATLEELQALKGIGPKRAEYILRYREQVTMIRNTFYLAAATGMSLKAAEKLATDVSWETSSIRSLSLWPVMLTTLAAIWLIVLGFNELASEPFVPPAGYFNLALALILLGGFTATGDIAIASVRNSPSETSWVFLLATLLTLSGILLLGGLWVASWFVSFGDSFDATLNRTSLFIACCLAITWQMYAPVLMIRLFIDDKSIERLEKARLVYDISLMLFPLIAVGLLFSHNTDDWIEEIFTAWCLVIAAIAAKEWWGQGTAFVTMLSEEDQGRLRFTYLRHSGE